MLQKAKLKKIPSVGTPIDLLKHHPAVRDWLYRLAVGNLVGDPAPPPTSIDAPPQLGEGTMGIVSTDGAERDLGRVYASTDFARINWTENWVAPDGFLTLPSFELRQVSGVRLEPWTTLVQTDLDGQNGHPLWSDCKKAVLGFKYTVPPGQTAIDVLPPAPAGWGRKEYAVKTVRAGGMTVTGALYREYRPAGSLSWTDHWRLWPAYVMPFGGPVSVGGVVTRLDEVAASASLKAYLTAQRPNAGVYVQVSYTWMPF